MSVWVLASGNAGKLREIRLLGEQLGLRIAPQSDFGLVSPPETAATFVENALLKARYAAERTGLAALADDSGLLVEALGGEPGVTSARYAGADADDRDNVAKLLSRLAEVPDGRRSAQFYCVIVALRHATAPAPAVVCGRWRGAILREPVGRGGFGYDPVFFDPRLGASAAQLPPEVKNEVSHRGQALRRLSEALAQLAVSGP